MDFSALKMEVYVPPKRQFTQYLHGTTTQKTAFFIESMYAAIFS
jgi:hypothetical protein